MLEVVVGFIDVKQVVLYWFQKWKLTLNYIDEVIMFAYVKQGVIMSMWTEVKEQWFIPTFAIF